MARYRATRDLFIGVGPAGRLIEASDASPYEFEYDGVPSIYWTPLDAAAAKAIEDRKRDSDRLRRNEAHAGGSLEAIEELLRENAELRAKIAAMAATPNQPVPEGKEPEAPALIEEARPTKLRR